VKVDGDFWAISCSDDGRRKFTRSDLTLILDFSNKASSKRGLHVVQRGQLGNGLKSTFGFSHALSETRGLVPPPAIIQSWGFRHSISLLPDRVKATIGHSVQTVKTPGRFSTVTVKFPRDEESEGQFATSLRDLLLGTCYVNPSRAISCVVFGQKLSLGLPGSNGDRRGTKQQTSALWYTLSEFKALFEDCVRATPEAQLSWFMAMFRGFTSHAVIRQTLEKLQEGGFSGNHDSQPPAMQFFPTMPLRDIPVRTVPSLFRILKERSKPISKRSIPRVLGFVGEEAFQKTCEENGWRLKYTQLVSTHVETDSRRDGGTLPSKRSE
jgi:hypothetical protein